MALIRIFVRVITVETGRPLETPSKRNTYKDKNRNRRIWEKEKMSFNGIGLVMDY